MIEAKIICDSINPDNNRLTTFELTYPRFIHSELLTHRVFSRNSASSRAIPVDKMIETIQRNPAGPIVWGQNQKGMQAEEIIECYQEEEAKQLWKMSMESQIKFARMIQKTGCHKQIVNRLLEPFAYMKVILSGTEFGNFFNLRAHKDAQPEFQELAFQMLKVYSEHQPKLINWGNWHIPFGDKMPENTHFDDQLKISVARCARVSYMTHDGKIDTEADFRIFNQLKESGHMSPFEHVAFANKISNSNFKGWLQYRKTIDNENRVKYNTEELFNNRKIYQNKDNA